MRVKLRRFWLSCPAGKLHRILSSPCKALAMEIFSSEPATQKR